jgi:hypothetical protein
MRTSHEPEEVATLVAGSERQGAVSNGVLGLAPAYDDWVDSAAYDRTQLRIRAAYTGTLRLDPTTWKLTSLYDRIVREYPDLSGVCELFFEDERPFPTSLAQIEEQAGSYLHYFTSPALIDPARDYFFLLALSACHHTRMLYRDEPALLARIPITDEGHLYSFLTRIFMDALFDFRGGYWALLNPTPSAS